MNQLDLNQLKLDLNTFTMLNCLTVIGCNKKKAICHKNAIG